MNKIFLITIFIILISVSDSKQQQDNPVKLIIGNQLMQNYPDPFSEITLIEFITEGESYVKVYIADQSGENIVMLAEGEIGEGKHSVYYKPALDSAGNTYICKMEIYDPDKESIVFAEETLIHYDPVKNYGFKK